MYPRHPAMKRIYCCASILTVSILGSALPLITHAQQPVPVIKNMEVTASVSFDSAGFNFAYGYQVSSLPSNTGNVRGISIDVTTDLPQGFIDNPIPQYKAVVLGRLDEKGVNILPVNVAAPPGWDAVNLTALGTANWGGDRANTIRPGESLAGFVLTSQFPPGLRTLTITPQISTWNLYPRAEDPPDVQAQQDALIKGLDFVGQTLGPIGAVPGTFQHWNRVRDDLNRMISELQWINPTLGTTLVSQLATARNQLDASNGTAAKAGLQTLLNTVAQAPDGQIRGEARQFLQVNAQALIATTPDTPILFQPELNVTPKSTELSIGSAYILVAKVVNTADNDRPVPDFRVAFVIETGPHAGTARRVLTDANGEASFSYVGTQVGLDRIEVGKEEEGEIDILAEARVRWTGGPDLVVPLFMPPVITTEEGESRLRVTDVTANLGRTASSPSVTRYFLSATEPLDPSSATPLGERQVEALEPEQFSNGVEIEVPLPNNLPVGTYFLAACADANATVVELDETNNCSFNRLERVVSIVVQGQVANSPPDCTRASASPNSLWPPNHKLVAVNINGLSDPDGGPITLSVTSITQDEPVNGVADGNTSPDGFGVGSPQASVRSERSGQGDGRIYEIGFIAQDDKGASCTGRVSVGVPHDQGRRSTPVDSGARFDSTQG